MSFDKTAIEEANKHLQALGRRVVELEAVVKQQSERLENIEAENQAGILAVVRQKDAEIEQRNAWLEETQAEIRRLNIEVINKDVTISQLSAKAAILDKAFRYKPELDGLLKCLVEAENLNAAASGLSQPAAMPQAQKFDEPQTVAPIKSSDPQNRSLEDDSSESSLSEEDFSETEQTNVIWTPKAKIQPDHENMQNLSLNGRKTYVHPSRVPGGAVKNKGDTSMPMEAETEQISQSNPNFIPPNIPVSQDNMAGYNPLANYETQL